MSDISLRQGVVLQVIGKGNKHFEKLPTGESVYAGWEDLSDLHGRPVVVERWSLLMSLFPARSSVRSGRRPSGTACADIMPC